jgi:hypothetical protein
MRRRDIHTAAGLILVIGALIPQHRSANAQSTTRPDVAGHYTAHRGDPARDTDASVMTLDLKSGGTMSSTLTMADPANPGQTVVSKVEGTWTQSGDVVKVIAEKLDGQPVEANNPRKTLTLKVTDGGRQLNSDGGPQFTRQ